MLGIDFNAGPIGSPTSTHVFYGATGDSIHRIRFTGTNLTVNAYGWIDGGTIASMQVYDYSSLPPTAVVTVNFSGGGVPGAEFADYLSPLVAPYTIMQGWSGFGTAGGIVEFASDSLVVALADGTFVKIVGHDFVPGTSSVGTVTDIQHLSGQSGSVIEEINGLSLSLDQASLLVGNDYALYEHLATGGSVVTELPGAYTSPFQSAIGYLSAGLGNDRIVGCVGESQMVGYGDAVSAVVVDLDLGRATGGAGTDVLVNIEHVMGSAFGDTIRGDAASNFLMGMYGDDVLLGRDGDDGLVGGGGNDSLNGGNGNDILLGDAGDDTLNGGQGNDAASFMTDTTDFLFTETAGVTVDLRIHGAQNTGRGLDTLISIENVEGSNFDDTIIGNGVDNILDGQGGNDNLIASAGNDSLYGRDGLDVLRGGAGADNFVFNFQNIFSGPDFVDGRDRIADFQSGGDKIVLTDSFLYGGGASALAVDNFYVVGSGTQDANDYVIYDQAAGRLFYDANGNGAGGRELIAVLLPGQSLAASDIIFDLHI